MQNTERTTADIKGLLLICDNNRTKLTEDKEFKINKIKRAKKLHINSDVDTLTLFWSNFLPVVQISIVHIAKNKTLLKKNCNTKD